jgi:hypothetical protein
VRDPQGARSPSRSHRRDQVHSRAGPKLTHRLLREARAQARIDHRNVCRVYEVGEIEGRAYIALQLVTGEPLHKAAVHMSLEHKLGATLYELLTGRPPFATTSLAVALTQILLDDPPAPRSLVPSLPVDLETIALKCLAKDPAQRYGSARALADDLEHYLAGEPILGRRPSLWQRVRRRARRQRALFVLGASSLVVVAVVAAFGLRAWLISRSERARAVELTEHLGRDTTKIERALHDEYLVPLHDISRQRERADFQGTDRAEPKTRPSDASPDAIASSSVATQGSAISAESRHPALEGSLSR